MAIKKKASRKKAAAKPVDDPLANYDDLPKETGETPEGPRVVQTPDGLTVVNQLPEEVEKDRLWALSDEEKQDDPRFAKRCEAGRRPEYVLIED